MTRQRVSNERKKELDEFDPFQEFLIKALDTIKEYKKPLLIGLIALIAAFGAFGATVTSFRNSQKNASMLLAKATTNYYNNKDSSSAYQSVKSDFNKIFEEYSNTAAGKIARLKFANIAYAAKDYDTAHEMYQIAYEKFKKDPCMKELLCLSLGNVCVARKEYDKGIKFFEKALEYKNGIWKEQATFMIAQLYEIKKDPVNSQKFYQQLPLKQTQSSIYQQMARERISVLP